MLLVLVNDCISILLEGFAKLEELSIPNRGILRRGTVAVDDDELGKGGGEGFLAV